MPRLRGEERTGLGCKRHPQSPGTAMAGFSYRPSSLVTLDAPHATDYHNSAPMAVRGGTGILLAAASVSPVETAGSTAGTAVRPMGETPMPRPKAHRAL